jgi:glyoxylase-like metal-dependent hydrolase (beta-lactamase superfamily II)
MPATYAHLMITEKALEWFRGNQDINEKLRGVTLTHSHFVHLGSVGPDYPHFDFLEAAQKVAVESPLLIFPIIVKGKKSPVRYESNPEDR